MQAENVPLKAHMSISYKKLSKIGIWKNRDIKTSEKKNIFSSFSKSVCFYTSWTEPSDEEYLYYQESQNKKACLLNQVKISSKIQDIRNIS